MKNVKLSDPIYYLKSSRIQIRPDREKIWLDSDSQIGCDLLLELHVTFTPVSYAD